MLQKYKIFSFLILLSVEFGLEAQTFKGRVLDAENRQPVAFATVFINELSNGTLTDSSGNFEFQNFPSSEVSLKISAVGYGSSTFTASVNMPQPVVYHLTSAHIHLDEIIVSTPFGKLQQENVTNVEWRRINELNRIPTMTLSDAITNIPGVYTSSLGAGIGKPVIRGLSGTRILTYLNGLRIENQQWGDDHGMGLTDLGVDAVEIIKGPASLLYGSDALGGVLYFVNEPYAHLNSFEGYVQSQSESNSLGSSNKIGLKWNKNGVKLNFFGGHTFQGDYMMPNGYRIFDSRFSSSAAKISLGYNKKFWVGNLHYGLVNSFVGLPGHTHDDSLYAALFYSNEPAWLKTLPHQFITNHFISLENKFYFEKSTFEILLGYTINHLREFEEKYTIPGMDLRLDNSLGTIKWKRELGKKVEFIVGGQGMYQINHNNPKAEETLIPDNTSLDAGLFSLLLFEHKNLTLQGGLRYDLRKVETKEAFNGFEAFNKQYQSFNYSAGLAYQADSLSFRINISSGYRAPHTSELLANGIHHGTFRYTIGDLDLKTEYATQIDFSLGAHYDHLEIIFNPFFNQINNYIFLSPQDTVIENYPVYQYSQSDKAQLFGGDFSLHLHPHFAHWLHIQSSFSYIYAQQENATPLPLIPQNRLNTQLKFELHGHQKFSLADVVVQHYFYFAQNRVSSFETPTSAYHLINIGLNFKWITKNQPVLFQLGVKNLLNTDYIDHLSRLKNIGLSMPGINFYFGIKYQFEKRLNTKNK